ncbi:hypothetical protein HYT84_01150 [Candidatus Micrarchaeota archaeon]|nr:hypothetical protein [Candidatus Micrarchaeota archaeon]
MFSVLIFLPAGKISEKVFYYQITSLDSVSLILMLFFSIVLGILFSMNIYLFKRTHESKAKLLGSGSISIVSSFIASIFGSSVCVACLSIFVGFIGLPVITVILAYRRELFFLSALIALGSLYLVSKSIAEHGKCNVCKVSVSK